MPTEDSLFRRHFHHLGQDYLNLVMAGQGLLCLCLGIGKSFLRDMWDLFLWEKREVHLLF